MTYGLSDERDLWATDVKVAADGVRYVARTRTRQALVRLRLTGRFNVYNSLAALAVGIAEGIDLEEAAVGIAETVVPGRFEPVNAGQEFAVIVDYAHTPDSLENVLRTARSLAKERVICVVGAGGDRDRTKRPIMGQIAAELPDYVVITSDNPRSEEPEAICREVAEAPTERYDPFDIIVDRREAIRQAVSVADTGDLVLITGKVTKRTRRSRVKGSILMTGKRRRRHTGADVTMEPSRYQTSSRGRGAPLQGATDPRDELFHRHSDFAVGSLFSRSQGSSFDGHDFIDAAVAKGASAVVAKADRPLSLPPGSHGSPSMTHPALGRIAQGTAAVFRPGHRGDRQ